MPVVRLWFIITGILLAFVYCCFKNGLVYGVPTTKPKLIVISFDGFRYDYLNVYKNETSNFRRFVEEGLCALNGTTSSFPTSTIPNHYTMVTGLYPESHGIVDNYFYDPDLKDNFTMKRLDSKWFNGGEPIWVTAKKHNVRSGVYMWLGSEVAINGIKPDQYQEHYNDSISFTTRIEQVISWVKNDDVDLAMAYFNEPDHMGHVAGPMSKSVKKAIVKVNNILGILLQQLETLGLLEKINILVISDHGMAKITKNIYLSDYIDLDDTERISQYGVVNGIFPKVGREDKIISGLNKIEPGLVSVHWKRDIPERFHYKNNIRIPPIVAIASEGILFRKQSRIRLPYPEKLNDTIPGISQSDGGTHGYDNLLPSMRPIFLAMGPSIKRGSTVPYTYENVNYYSLMCHLLGIEPAPNNGSLEHSRHFLVEIPSTLSPSTPPSHSVALRANMCFISFAFSILVFGFYNVKIRVVKRWKC